MLLVGFALLPRPGVASAQDATLLHGGDPWVGERRGTSVACSADLERVVVGALHAGARIFVRDGADWRLEHELRSDDDGLGTSVAMDADGRTVAVGAPARGGAGAVRVLTRDGDGWHLRHEVVAGEGVRNGRFGAAVALSGDGQTLLVGAPHDTRSGAREAGSVHVFVRRDTSWIETATLDLGRAAAGDLAGAAVALSYDGSRALVGVRGASAEGAPRAGAAWVVRLDGEGHARDAVLLATPHDAGAALGASVALSSDGTVAVVGAPRRRAPSGAVAGAGYVFELGDGDGWRLGATEEGRTRGQSLGMAVAISADGRTVLVGAPIADARVRVLARSESGWALAGTLVPPPDADPRALFGAAVALGGDGDGAVVGAPQLAIDTMHEAGAAYVTPITRLSRSAPTALEGALDASARADLAAHRPAQDEDREIRDVGLGTLIVGALTTVGGGLVMLGGALSGQECASAPFAIVQTCTYHADEGLLWAGGVLAGVGAIGLVTGGLLYSQRQRGPRHPGVILSASPAGVVAGFSLTF